ncbi:sensor histidine kinase [Paenibacillus ginsengarvi]|uniref:histidine kinase n=1 Tax=Paenibacillus ginsengarvi TaxID=400777 RepID=A0A3B0C8L6_9BACL|nr:HAMP domain-containing sensor histidine kinase [Paenibacillus ginsengarvi]RKN80724.1 sensor histidine kinase [Paenibacillus ginsengarvi]
MKLFVQINVAFGVLLVFILSAIAVLFHFVLLDHFITVQKNDMQQASATISTHMQADSVAMSGVTGAASVANVTSVTTQPSAAAVAISPITATLTPVLGFDAVITDNDSNIVYSTLPASTLHITAQKLDNVSGVQIVQEGKDERFLVASKTIDAGMLTLFTPMSKIQAIEKSLLGRLLVVLCIGGALVFLLSLVITRKLIKPLMQLQGELRKVENRRFSEVKRIRAGGEIGVVAETVYDMAEELEKYNRIQKQFIQNASHELKTPLMSIAGYAEGIRDGIFEGEDVRKGLDVIISESGRLKNIVTEMTLLAKLDGEEHIFRMDAVPIAEMITETIERINPLLVRNGLAVEVDYSDEAARRTVIRADRDKLLQALLNVVSNATRYARKEIRIRISRGKKQIDISITDDGDGIPSSLLPHLFHRFVKGKDGETGLGLAISRAIVERCGGCIAARNHETGGADVSMRFPAA